MTAHAAPVPVRVRDVAQVAIGGEIRTGSASENGHEVVVGTALMASARTFCLRPAEGQQRYIDQDDDCSAVHRRADHFLGGVRRDAQLETEIMI
jgi:hypothetical protein